MEHKNTIKNFNRKIICTSLFFIVIAGFIGGYPYFLVYNATASQPIGFYLKSYPNSYLHNDLVLVCPVTSVAKWSVEHHIIADGMGCQYSAPLLKKIVATAGDRVTVTHKGIIVNDTLIPNTAPIARKVKQWNTFDKEFLLKSGEYIVVANQNNLSFDSRYFGVVTDKNIIAKIRPIFIFD